MTSASADRHGDAAAPWSAFATAIGYLAAIGIPVAVFYLTPVVNRIYDGWPRGWLVLSVSMLAAYLRGVGPGLTALASGALLIWWRGVYFSPMHPGIEVFAVIGLLQIIIIHRLQLTERELRRRQEALESERNRARCLYETAQAAARAKDEFLAVLSHELRTPLNVILGYSRMLHRRMGTAEFAQRAAGIIVRNAMSQIRLIEDLLDVQRFKTGIRIERGRFDLHALADTVIESLQPAAAAKSLHLAGRVEPLVIDADGARIQQVLWNLLSNAIKFTPEGGCVGLSAAEEDDDVVITVEDSGQGIPPEFLPHVFEPFRQLDMSSTRRHGGLGLGLAIVKNIVDAHGGTVVADSDVHGTRFTLRLPQRPTLTAPGGGEQQVA